MAQSLSDINENIDVEATFTELQLRQLRDTEVSLRSYLFQRLAL